MNKKIKNDHENLRKKYIFLSLINDSSIHSSLNTWRQNRVKKPKNINPYQSKLAWQHM
jgi:hypothetical protein